VSTPPPEYLGLEPGPGVSAPSTRLPVQGLLVIGSGPEAQLRIEGHGLLPRHAAVAPVKGGGYGIKALSDGARLWLNGQEVRAARLSGGDSLRLAEARFEVRPLGPAPGAEPAAPSAAPSAQPASVAAQPPGAVRPASGNGGRGAAGAAAGDSPPPGRGEALPQVPGYRVERLLGRGALAKVYLAEQEKLARPVALKLLNPRWAADQAFVARFQAEARAAAALHHAHVVTVFDVGHAGGWHYLALEYMDRGSLEDRLASEGPLPWRAVLGILRDAALGLEFARQKGLVHRDIKPANLMQNAGGQTKIADLGLAASEAEAGDVGAAEGRRIVGTPHFMAPEQARGEAVDHRADLYALGASAYRLLCGSNAYEGSDPREILRAKLAGPHKPLAERRPDLPSGVVQLVEELLARDPAARPARAELLAARIAALVENEGRPAKSGRRLWPVAGLLLLGIAVGGYAWLQGGGPEPTPTTPSPQASEPAGAQPAASGNGQSPEASPEPTSPRQALPLAPSGDEDRSLRELEARAQESLARAQSTPDPLARRAALGELIQSFAGTDAARLAQGELETLGPLAAGPGSPEAAPEPAAGPDEAAWAGWLEAYRRLGQELRPAEELAAKATFSVPPGIDAGEWTRRSAALLEARQAQLAETARQRGAAIAALLREARFEQARLELDALRTWLQAAPAAGAGAPGSPAPAAEAPDSPALPLFEPAWQRVDDWLARLEEFEAAQRLARRSGDRARLAAALAGGEWLAELERLEFAAARARLLAVTPFAPPDFSPAIEAPRTALSALLELAAGAPDLLASTFEQGEWRRKTVRLPGERRGGGEVIAVRGGALVVLVSGVEERFPLADYADDPALLTELFDGRLSREWSADERQRFGAWVALQALLQAARQLLAGLEGPPREIDSAPLVDAYQRAAADLLATPGSAVEALLAADRRALLGAAAALRAAALPDWTLCAYELEALFGAAPEGPLLWLLSSGVRGVAAPVWPPEELSSFP
jgi:serine/threonine protein kinase